MPKPWLFQEKLISALSDEALIKHCEAALYQEDMNHKAFLKALNVIRTRLASGDINTQMVLRILRATDKVTASLLKLEFGRSR
jgi:hypothetical protein